MRTFVVLIRGINVGSTRKLPMAELRALCTELGLAKPETYIQSGNLVVDATGDAKHLRDLLEKELGAKYAFPIHLAVREARDWAKIIEANPFAGDANALGKMVHLCLTRETLKASAAHDLRERAKAGERIEQVDGNLWIDYADSGIADSKLTPATIDKACGSPATGRNLNTLLKIQEMIDARSG